MSPQEGRDDLRARRDRQTELGGVLYELVLANDGLIRADGEIVERSRCIGAPSVCASSESEGTSTSVLVLASRSAIHNPASVFPVPQAMINCPRSWSAKPLTVSSTASRTCGSGCLRDGRRGRTSTADAGHATRASSSCERRRYPTGRRCESSVLRAVSPSRSVVAISSR